MNIFEEYEQQKKGMVPVAVEEESPKKEGLLKKVARVVLPKSLEYKWGITEKPKEEITPPKISFDQFYNEYQQKKQEPSVAVAPTEEVSKIETPIEKYLREEGIPKTELRAPKPGEWVDFDTTWTPKEIKETLEYVYLKPDPGSPREQQMKDIAYTRAKELYDPISSLLFDTFIPTKTLFALDRDAKYMNEARKRVEGEFAQEHPYLTIVPVAVATIANLKLIGVTGGGFGLSGTVPSSLGKLANWTPNLVRMAGLGTESASIFGIEALISEALNQAQLQEIKPLKLTTETLKGVGTGLSLGATGALPKLWQRTLGVGTTLATISALEEYLRDGKIDGKDLSTIITNGLIGAGFELVGGRKKTKIFQQQREIQFGRDMTIARIQSNHPGMSWEEATKVLNTIEWLPKAIVGAWQDRIYAYYQEVPKEFFAWSKDIQNKYFTNVTEFVAGGQTIPQAITNTNSITPFKAMITTPGVVSPATIAEYAAKEIDRKLTGQEYLRQSPKGRELLREQLAREEAEATKKVSEEKLEQQVSDIVDYVLGKKPEAKPTEVKAEVKEILKPEEKTIKETPAEELRFWNYERPIGKAENIAAFIALSKTAPGAGFWENHESRGARVGMEWAETDIILAAPPQLDML